MKRAPVGTARCCAGFPSPAEQYQEPLGLRLPSKADAFSADILDLNELLVKRPAATYFVRVEGDSMVGAGINDGDLLVVDRSLRPADGDVIIASVEISPERSEHCEAMSLEGCDFLGRTVVFPAPTDATNEMLRAIREEVDALYIEGTRYRKTGIVFFGLEKPGTAHQTDLFDDTPPAEKSRLYAAVDALNARYGKGKVFSAAQGLGARSWHMKRQKLSARPTTRWDELMTVR